MGVGGCAADDLVRVWGGLDDLQLLEEREDHAFATGDSRGRSRPLAQSPCSRIARAIARTEEESGSGSVSASSCETRTSSSDATGIRIAITSISSARSNQPSSTGPPCGLKIRSINSSSS